MQPGDGERLHAAQRKRFWGIIVLLMGIGLAAGFVGGFAVGFTEKQGTGLDPWMRDAGAAAYCSKGGPTEALLNVLRSVAAIR